ncbi:MAG: MaoC family dehydratase N-terminal domain-containing protein [Acidobacteria bacterium]|nr:MaoC family dehydratase N-terminal domain-containing protein [Acidobacteriota bacterium]
MGEYDEFIGKPTSVGVVTVERGTVTAFAASVLDDRAEYRNRDAAVAAGFADLPVPPTYWFSAAQNWGQWEEEQPNESIGTSPMNIVMGGLMATGGMILHGEQEFTFHRNAVVGEKLHQRGVVKDIYTKQSGDRTMTFMVVETTYTDDAGAPVVTSTMNLIHRS